MNKFILLTALLIHVNCSYGQLPPMPPRPAVNMMLAPFYHGVASGDPLSDRVIIWTRVTPTVPGSISVNWQIAKDSLFAQVVNSGTVTTDSSVDFTVKVDATGLTANTWYYYRFKTGSTYSITGRTKTLPTGSADSIRLAVFSCSDFQAGYYNVYNDISKRNDLSAIVHLGDYYYEYAAGTGGSSGDTSRYHPLNHDACTIGDYRLWQSQYKLDQDLRAMLEQYPIIQVWDDHEAANNGWYSSAENHNWATQGNWFVRKNASKKAFFEWNPVRKIAPGNDSIIHRNFKFGNLFNLIMIDTRLEGRDSSLGALIPITNAYMNDTNRRMLGPVQLDWLKNQLSDNSTQWKIVGEQIMIAKLALNVLITTEVLNGDQWDGYPAERRRVFRHISQNNIKDVVFLSGDLHTSWAADLPSSDSTYVPTTGAGSVATEFIGGSVTTPGFIPVTGATIQAADPWFKYAELSKHGYLLFDINQSRVQGDFIHVSNIDTRTYTTANDAQWQNLNNERHLRIATTPLNPNYGHNPPLVSWYPTGTGVQPVNNNLVVFSCYPNPTSDEVHLQLYIDEPGKLDIAISDLNGKVVYSTSTAAMPRGMNTTTLNIGDLSDGVYMITINTGKGSYSNKIIKGK